MDAPVGPALIFIGVLCVIAAIAGGAKILGNEIPIVGSTGRQVVLAVVGAIFAGAGGYFTFIQPQFRVTAASATSDRSMVLFCPSTVTYTAVIEVSGGPGDVEYRFVHNHSPMQTYTLAFAERQRARSLTLPIQVDKPVFDFLDNSDDMQIEILAPNHVTSAPVSVPISC